MTTVAQYIAMAEAMGIPIDPNVIADLNSLNANPNETYNQLLQSTGQIAPNPNGPGFVPGPNYVPVQQVGGSTRSSNTSPATAVTANSNLPADQQDAFAIVAAQLADWGLTGLDDFVRQQINAGYSPTMIELNLRKTPQYKEAFGNVNDARVAAGLSPLSPREIIDYRSNAKALEHQFGLPSGILSKSETDALLVADVSASELTARVQDGFARLNMADDFTKQSFTQLYQMGVTPGEIASFVLNPSVALPLIERRLTTAEIGGRGLEDKLTLSKGFLESLAAQGETRTSVTGAFNQTALDKPLTTALIGETHPEKLNQEGIAGGLLGLNADALTRLKREQEGRLSPFQDKGGIETDLSARGGGVTALKGGGV